MLFEYETDFFIHHFHYNQTMQQTDEKSAIKLRLETLRLEHRDLDALITQLTSEIKADQLQLSRMKKRKLWLKDMITRLESKLIPDLNA